MCGLAGFLRAGGSGPASSEESLRAMTDRLVHRGPDASGAWLDDEAGIAFGHRRLAILDLSPAGLQPMISSSGRYVIVINGEIYNHAELRATIDGMPSPPAWRGHSDTETLLAVIEHRGIEGALAATVGMFALAVWDRQERQLTLARDRVGEKPLYYGWFGDVLLFGSELKALRRHPAFRGDISREALAMYMRGGYIPAPYSIFNNVRKLRPGCLAQVSVREPAGTEPRIRSYWSMRETAERGIANAFGGSDREATDLLESELSRAIGLQSVADVPVGAFFSGGVDSSAVVALLQAQSSRPVRTFTIGFLEPDFQEAGHARAIARHLRTDHTELEVTAREALDVVSRLPVLYDEPFGDSSAIPTFLVSQLARTQVTVALSGDGGDELFGGYSRYRRTLDIWDKLRRIPAAARRPMSLGFDAVHRAARTASIGWRANRLARYLGATNAGDCYRAQVFQRNDEHEIVPGSADGAACGCAPLAAIPSVRHPYDAMMYADSMAYLPDDILVKVDRASMAVSLETRAPMLDHRVIELAWRLPLDMKLRNGEGKWLLKRVLERHVPASMTDRPKKGFGIPVGQWIRGPLREWAEELLGERRLAEEGFLSPHRVREQWSRHLRGGTSEGDAIWHILMFQAWLAEWGR